MVLDNGPSFALIESINNNDRRNICRSEWFDYEFLYLAVERLMHNVRVLLEEGDDDRSEFRVLVCQVEGECGEDEAKVAPVLEIAGTEERRSQQPVSECNLTDRLANRRLVSPSEPVQPEDGRFVETFGPQLDLVPPESVILTTHSNGLARRSCSFSSQNASSSSSERSRSSRAITESGLFFTVGDF